MLDNMKFDYQKFKSTNFLFHIKLKKLKLKNGFIFRCTRKRIRRRRKM